MRWVKWGLWGGGGTLVGLIALWQSSGVEEVHRAHLPVNFPLAAPQPTDEDWPWWLGPHQDGFVLKSHSPLRWAPGENIGWQTRLAGTGHGSPIVWGANVYLTEAEEAAGVLRFVCLDRLSGRVVWRTDAAQGQFSKPSGQTPYAAPTPACDGERIYAATHQAGSLVVSAVDLNGRVAWLRPAGPSDGTGRHGSSPLISGSLVIVSADQADRPSRPWSSPSYIAALHRTTGELIWRVTRPDDALGPPIVATVAGREQLVFPGRRSVTAYDPSTGDTLWTCRWTAEGEIGNIAYDANRIYAVVHSGRNQVLSIRADGSGDVTKSHVDWREQRLDGELSSPIVCGDELLILGRQGLLTCLDKEGGALRWTRRLKGPFSATPVAVAQYVYCVNEDGLVFVVDRASRGEIIATNPVGKGCFSPPAITGASLLFRSAKGVLLVQSPAASPFVNLPPAERRR